MKGGVRRRYLLALLVVLGICGCSSREAAPPLPSQPATSSPAPTTGEPTTSRQASVQASVSTSTATQTSKNPSTATIRYVFPVQGCQVSYGRAHHDYPATDIFASPGCAFVAPVAGTVDEVNRVDRWNPSTNRGADRGGLSVSLVGADGVRYYGSHLQSIAPGITPGVEVSAGRLLGRVGNSGNARSTASHLHFGISWRTPKGIWWIRRGVLYPWRYLDSWRRGGNLSPVSETRKARAAAGQPVPPCTVGC